MKICPICGQNKVSADFSLANYEVWACKNCGFRYLDPQPTDAELSQIYSTSYFLDEGDVQSADRVNALKRATAKLYLQQMLTRRSSFPMQPKLLEIGCGRGDFLLEAQSKGFDVSGLEVTDHLVDVANQRLGRAGVQKGYLEHARFEEKSFDVVALFDVIEHVRNPIDFLTRVNGLLKTPGLVYLVTPSLDSWSAKLLGKNWMEYKVEHLSYFDKAAIVLLLKKTGFHTAKFLSNYKVLSLDYISRHFVRFPVRGFSPLVKLVRKAVPNRIAHMPFRVVASGLAVIAEKAEDRWATEENR